MWNEHLPQLEKKLILEIRLWRDIFARRQPLSTQNLFDDWFVEVLRIKLILNSLYHPANDLMKHFAKSYLSDRGQKEKLFSLLFLSLTSTPIILSMPLKSDSLQLQLQKKKTVLNNLPSSKPLQPAAL